MHFCVLPLFCVSLSLCHLVFWCVFFGVRPVLLDACFVSEPFLSSCALLSFCVMLLLCHFVSFVCVLLCCSMVMLVCCMCCVVVCCVVSGLCFCFLGIHLSMCLFVVCVALLCVVMYL